MRQRALRRRRRMALALCVLWLAGFEALPWAHVALHEQIAPHYHDANGAMVMLTGAAADAARVDEHEGHVHTHVYPAPPSAVAHGHAHSHRRRDLSDPSDRLAAAAALAHGVGALAHHGIAVPVPPPVWLQPLPIDRRPIYDDIAVSVGVHALDPDRATARGPPRAAARA